MKLPFSGPHRQVTRRDPETGDSYQHANERSTNPLSLPLILLAIAGFLCAATYNNFASTLRDYGKDIQAIRQNQSADSEWKSELSKWKDGMDTWRDGTERRMTTIEQQTFTDEVYLGLRRPMPKHAVKKQDGSSDLEGSH